MSGEDQFLLTAESGEVQQLQGTTVVGRGSDCDFRITEGFPSRKHAVFIYEDNEFFLKDLESSNGTFLNRVRVRTPQQLQDGDRISFGLTNFVFHRTTPVPAAPAAPTDPDATVMIASDVIERSHESRFVLRKLAGSEEHELLGPTVVGRSRGDDGSNWLELPNPGVSSKHARLTPAENGVLVEDLGSANGTFINDQRVTGEAQAIHGDHLRFHLIELQLSDRSTTDHMTDRAAKRANTGDVPEQDDLPQSARVGGTMMMPINPNLPPLWAERQSQSTAILSAQDRAQLNRPEQAIDHKKMGQSLDSPTLLVLTGPEAGRPYKLECLGEVNYWNIGRDPQKHELSIVLDDPSVSDFHAKLICREGRWKIIDQMSANSIFVNGTRHASAYLTSSDHIRIGRIDTLLLLPDEQTRQTTTAGKGWLRRLLERLGESHE